MVCSLNTLSAADHLHDMTHYYAPCPSLPRPFLVVHLLPSSLFQVHESPAEFAGHIKKAIFLQLTKWETDRAILEAKANRASEEAVVATKVIS